MGLVKEFKTFAMRGNVLDMAVGIIIGGAFGKIVSSFVTDVIMPPVGILVGGADFSDLKLVLKEPVLGEAGKIITTGVTLNYGMFINSVIDFIIIAFAIFMMIKAINRLQRKELEKAPEPVAPQEPSNEEKLLTEIRDLLKK
ncbi:MAG: large-conductance mechanosensitive channel protein MscL [Bacteroidales bacterium]|nr:large-conductance mechanosensitive channel protein MscL [Bacteroidales bacterium]